MSGTLRLKGSTSGYSELQAPAVAGDQTFILPVEGGTLLTTDSPFPTLTLESGTVTSPSLAFEGDSNTGIYSPGTNEVAVTTSGVQRLVADSSGNIGIGTSSPTQKLDLEGASGARIAFTDTGTRRWSIGTPAGGSTGFSIYDESGASEVIRITSGGKVGIGTTSPSQVLSVDGPSLSTTFAGSVITGSSVERLRIGYRDGGPDTGLTCAQIVEDINTLHISGRDTVNGDIIFHAGSSVPEIMRIDATNGNVGIGTTSPGRALHVLNSTSIVARFESTGTSFGGIEFKDANTTADFKVQLAAVGDELRFDAGGNERMRIDGTGNVGIGTNNPTKKLHISAGNAALLLDSTSNNNSGEISFTGKDNSGNSFETFKLNTAFNGSVTISTDPTNSAFSTANDIKFEQSGTETMRIASSGNVGIGATSPAEKLEVTGNLQLDAANASLKIKAGTTGNRGAVDFTFNTDSTIYGSLELNYDNRTTDGLKLSSDSYPITIQYDSGDFFRVKDSTTERMRIDSNGNVGIGTTSPDDHLHIEKNTSNMIRCTNTASFGQSNISLIGSRNDGGIAGTIQFFNFRNASDPNDDAEIFASINGISRSNDVTGTNKGGDLSISTRGTANGATLTERMRIKSGGSVGIGTGSPDSLLEVEGDASVGGIISRSTTTQSTSTNRGLRVRNNSNTDTFYVGFNGQSRIYTENDGLEIYGDIGTANTGGTKGHLLIKRGTNDVLVGSITSTTTTTAYNTSSDYRLKENVVEISDGITRVKQLQPKRFNFIANPNTTFDGFLAHEAQTVVPEAVTGTHNEVDDDGNAVMQGIDQSKLVPLLTAALQEAIAKIETLETKVAALEAGS